MERTYRAGFQTSVPKPAYIEELVSATTRVLGEEVGESDVPAGE
jgi:hypothetical protein